MVLASFVNGGEEIPTRTDPGLKREAKNVKLQVSAEERGEIIVSRPAPNALQQLVAHAIRKSVACLQKAFIGGKKRWWLGT